MPISYSTRPINPSQDDQGDEGLGREPEGLWRAVVFVFDIFRLPSWVGAWKREILLLSCYWSRVGQRGKRLFRMWGPTLSCNPVHCCRDNLCISSKITRFLHHIAHYIFLDILIFWVGRTQLIYQKSWRRPRLRPLGMRDGVTSPQRPRCRARARGRRRSAAGNTCVGRRSSLVKSVHTKISVW